MAKSKKPRKPYRPRSTAGTSFPIDRMRRRDPADVDVIVAGFRSSLETIASGKHPGVEEWRHLTDVVNLIEALTLDLHLLDDSAMPVIEACVEAMTAAAGRWKTHGVMRVDGPGLEALREAIDVFEQCERGFTVYVMDRAREAVAARVAALIARDEVRDAGDLVDHPEVVAL